MSADDIPPFIHHCAAFHSELTTPSASTITTDNYRHHEASVGVDEQCELPLIDVSSLVWSGSTTGEERRRCVAAIADASSEWGFFQVLNHGISKELLDEMRREQEELFKLPFETKSTSANLHGFSYRWGAPTATSLRQFSWSEAFHVPLSLVSDRNPKQHWPRDEFSSLREVMERFAKAMSKLVQALVEALAEALGQPPGGGLPAESCRKGTCFLRLNRYPRCPYSPEVLGLTPHTDSDFLTVVWQDQVGGLQLLRNSRWVAVRPNADALVVNIGDLLQVWSNGEYKSVMHKVGSNGEAERYSIAYFMCPSYDTVVGSWKQPSMYRSFTFGEYRRQVQDDVRRSGNKVGLPRFLISR